MKPDAPSPHGDAPDPADRVLSVAELGPLAFNRLAGRAHGLSLHRDGATIASLRHPVIARHPGALAIPLPAEAAGRLAVGDRVGVRLAQPEAVYGFDTTILDLREAPGAGRRVLVLACPEAVRVSNRRRSWRAALDAPVTAHPLPDPRLPDRRPVAGRLVDLSTGGCALRLPRPLPPGLGLDLELHLPGGVIRVRGEVLRATDGDDEARLAVAFDDHLPPDVRERLHHVVLLRHRLALAGEAAEAEPTSSG